MKYIWRSFIEGGWKPFLIGLFLTFTVSIFSLDEYFKSLTMEDILIPALMIGFVLAFLGYIFVARKNDRL